MTRWTRLDVAKNRLAQRHPHVVSAGKLSATFLSHLRVPDLSSDAMDNGSRDLLVALLKDEESHVDWLEAQVHQIKEMGYERYLTMQTGDFKDES